MPIRLILDKMVDFSTNINTSINVWQQNEKKNQEFV